MSAFIRVLVVSDSHGNRRNLRAVLERHADAAAVFHLGDGAVDMENVAEDFPAVTVYGVCGNCDSALRLTPESVETVVGGKRFFAAHGHAFGVKSSPLRFLMEARSRLVDVALFGHTHQPLLHGEEGLILLNPGSVRDGCYAVIDVVNGAIFPHLERL